MLLTKTIKLKLYVNSKQIALFKQMSEQYRLACNFVSQYIFDNNFVLNSNHLNKALYHCVREQFNLNRSLPSQSFVLLPLVTRLLKNNSLKSLFFTKTRTENISE